MEQVVGNYKLDKVPVQDMVEVAAAIASLARVVCITRGSKGSLVLEGGAITAVPAPAIRAVDSNGAGDMFAGAFLFAASHGYPHDQAALLANRCAAAVVSQHGNRLRPEQLLSLKAEFEREVGVPA